MDLHKLREKSIDQLLKQHGYEIKKSTGKYNKYLSPLRKETEASFVVDKAKNRWKDFGNNQHGSVIDLVMILEHCSFPEACRILEGGSLNLKSYTPIKTPKVGIDIVDVKPVTNQLLFDYAWSRRIPRYLVQKYLKEVYYYYPKENEEPKVYFALGFENSLGGFELRSRFAKVSSLPKTFTKIKGDDSKYNLFEGFFDFLAALAYYKQERFKYTTYILNGTGQMVLLRPFIENKQGRFFVDNDKAGTDCIEGLQGQDMRHVFNGYNDFNDMLKNI